MWLAYPANTPIPGPGKGGWTGRAGIAYPLSWRPPPACTCVGACGLSCMRLLMRLCRVACFFVFALSCSVGDRLTVSSWLSKQGANLGIWVKRWYELSTNKLSWYASASKKVETGNLPLFLLVDVEVSAELFGKADKPHSRRSRLPQTTSNRNFRDAARAQWHDSLTGGRETNAVHH
jgi:hypothetical protein